MYDELEEVEKKGVAAESRPTVILLHANAGNVVRSRSSHRLGLSLIWAKWELQGHRLPIAKIFHKNMRANILALSYRVRLALSISHIVGGECILTTRWQGYGKSEGTANEKGIRLDAQTALDYVLSHPRLERTKIILYGQSIGRLYPLLSRNHERGKLIILQTGGAVAIGLAAQNATRIHGLIVENTFLSLRKLVPHVMPFLKPFLFLLHQIWPSEQLVAGFPAELPVLYLSGAKDELIPPYQMTTLYQTSGGRKEFKSFENGTHSTYSVIPSNALWFWFSLRSDDTCIQPGYFQTIATFISAIVPPRVPKSSPASDDGSYDLLGDTEGEDEEEIEKAGGAGSKAGLLDVTEEKIKEKLEEKL